MVGRAAWTRQQLLIAFALYCRLPFGRLHYKNPEIIKFADAIGRSPSALAMKLSNIASLDPAITSTGRTGLSQTSTKDREMWQEMQEDWARFAVKCQQAIVQLQPTEESIDSTEQDETINFVGEDRVVQTTARIGQGFFRSAVLSAYRDRCCITGLSIPALIVASHIVPWRHDKLNRVNPRNGLALSTLHDKAFDTGLITINDDMTVRVSHAYAGENDPFFSTSIKAYDGKPIHVPEKFVAAQEFLAFHREHVFQK